MGLEQAQAFWEPEWRWSELLLRGRCQDALPHPLFQRVKVCLRRGQEKRSSAWVWSVCVDWSPGGGCGEAEGLLCGTGLEGRGPGVRLAPRPHSGLRGCRSSAGWALATSQRPWEGALARLGMFLLHSPTAFGLLLPALFSPRGRDLVFSWQRRGCWEGKIEPASFVVELEAWGHGCSCPLGD